MKAEQRAVAAEFLGTAALLAVVVGSGIMAERLSPANLGVALLANALVTGLGLFVLITVFGPVSGAHFNPVVTLAAWIQRESRARMALAYVAAQCLGAVAGVWLAHLMFDVPILQESLRHRNGVGQFASELVATTGLLVTIFGFSRHAPAQVAAAVGAYIAAAYWFTASTSFANPAVTIARSLTNTFAGISPSDIALFILAQGCGLAAGLGLRRVFWGATAR
jgi:glycerol uptake facilitator-like aquaporin